MTQAQSDALVFFGATGDLAFKKIFPALYSLVRRGDFAFPIIGVGRTSWTLAKFCARAQASIEEHGDFNNADFARFKALLQYVTVDYSRADFYETLRASIGKAKSPLFYLAIPPSVFPVIVEGLGKAKQPNLRLILEKPFGHDLASARELNQALRAHFSESAIFRIDHYLGKEAVQNLVYFRFANPVIADTWNKQHIASVQITMAETFGVSGRGKFYEENGAIRDVVQNHMLQTIACLAMECPSSNSQEAWRDARSAVLKAVRALTPADVVRGQFVGYRDEEGVSRESQVETYAVAQFFIDLPRWQGVPFFVRVGKCLPVTATEVWVQLKSQQSCLLADSSQCADNYYRFRLGPDPAIALGTNVKKPGELMEGNRVELLASHQAALEMGAYERLLRDAALGDATLFARSDSIEDSWRIVDAVLDQATPLHPYQPNTWGPLEGGGGLQPSGGWHNPVTR